MRKRVLFPACCLHNAECACPGRRGFRAHKSKSAQLHWSFQELSFPYERTNTQSKSSDSHHKCSWILYTVKRQQFHSSFVAVLDIASDSFALLCFVRVFWETACIPVCCHCPPHASFCSTQGNISSAMESKPTQCDHIRGKYDGVWPERKLEGSVECCVADDVQGTVSMRRCGWYLWDFMVIGSFKRVVKEQTP